MKATSLAGPRRQASHPAFGEAFRFWLKLGFISFGGLSGQIAIMHTELVEKKKWIDNSRFLHALNFLHVASRPGSDPARDLHWLALASHLGRYHRRRAFRDSISLHSLGLELHLCRIR